MVTERRSSAVVREELTAARQTLAAVKQDIIDTENRLKDLKEQEHGLWYSGWRSNSGTIANLMHELDRAEFVEQFEKSPKVVFSQRERYGNAEDCRVLKVTAKRIYVQTKSGHERKFNLDGTDVSDYRSDIIDIEKTFGVPEIDAKTWAKPSMPTPAANPS